MPKALMYSQTWFDCDAGGTSYAKYEAGRSYPAHEDAERHVALGIAEVIDVRAVEKAAPEKADRAEKTPGKVASAATEAVATP